MDKSEFNPISMPLDKLCGAWTMNNSLGVQIKPRGRIGHDWETFSEYIKADNTDGKEKIISFIKYLLFL